MSAETKPNGGTIPRDGLDLAVVAAPPPAPQTIEDRIGSLEKQLGEIIGILKDHGLEAKPKISIEGRFGGVSGQITSLAGKADNIQSQNDSLRLRTNFLAERIAGAEQRLDSIEPKVQKLRDRVGKE